MTLGCRFSANFRLRIHEWVPVMNARIALSNANPRYSVAFESECEQNVYAIPK